jgi:hypothetical protein
MRTMLAILAFLASGTAAIAGPPLPSHMITLGASWVGSSAIPATAPIRPDPNAWRRHPVDGTCIAMSTRASCSSSGRSWSSRVCSSVGGAAGTTESAARGSDKEDVASAA